MTDIATPIAAFALAIAVLGAAGSAAAASHGKSAVYPPVPQVNKNNTIPQKGALSARPVLAPKPAAVSGSARGGMPVEDGPPLLGVERAAPERQIPNTPVTEIIGKARPKPVVHPN